MGNKLKAFTLFELVLGMLLGAIVIGMAYYASFIFIRIYDGYSKINLAQSELALFKKALSLDVDRAAVLDWNQDELVLKDGAGELQLSYAFTKDYALRKSAVVDTFKLQGLFVQHHFEGHAVEDGWVDALVLSFDYGGKPLSFLVRKEYTSEELFNLKR